MGPRRVPKTLLDERESVGVELLRLGEHRLPHPDLAEVVEERCVAQLGHLVAGEAQPPVRLRGFLLDGPRQCRRVVRHTQRVARGGGVALLDRQHRGAHEALEEVLDLLHEPGVLDGNRRLGRQRPDERDLRLAERPHLGVRGIGREDSRVPVELAVDELQHADHLAGRAWRSEW